MISMAPRFSVVIPAYNAGAYIGETIESVLAQTESDWELIVVDDGSTDATPVVVAGFADDRITYTRQENQGVSVARNAGFSLSRGEYVLFLDADDILFPDALLRLGCELQAHPEMVLSYGDYTLFDSDHRLDISVTKGIRFRTRPSGDALSHLARGNFMTVGAVLARRDAVANTDGFDLDLAIEEDWAFWCELAALGPIRYVGPGPVLGYRIHSKSKTANLAIHPEYMWPAIDRVVSQPAVRQRFTPKALGRFRRRLEARQIRLAARQQMRARDWPEARRFALSALQREPLRIRTWGLFTCTILKWRPPAVLMGR